MVQLPLTNLDVIQYEPSNLLELPKAVRDGITLDDVY